MRNGAVAALLVVALLAGAAAGYFIGTTGEHTTTLTLPTTERDFQVTFQQVPYCGKYNILPWASTLNGITVVQPSNQSLPLPTDQFSTIVPDKNLTRITFSVPSGNYNATVEGGAGFGGELSLDASEVHVNGSNVFVNVGVWLGFTCTPDG